MYARPICRMCPDWSRSFASLIVVARKRYPDCGGHVKLLISPGARRSSSIAPLRAMLDSADSRQKCRYSGAYRPVNRGTGANDLSICVCVGNSVSKRKGPTIWRQLEPGRAGMDNRSREVKSATISYCAVMKLIRQWKHEQ